MFLLFQCNAKVSVGVGRAVWRAAAESEKRLAEFPTLKKHRDGILQQPKIQAYVTGRSGPACRTTFANMSTLSPCLQLLVRACGVFYD